jgi:hypothetical protein
LSILLQTYVIKLARSGGVTGSGESEKELLLLESGVRLHTTQFARDKSNTPSGITLKIRKHIRTRRLEDIRQLGVDRVRLNICFFEGILCCMVKYVILANVIRCIVPTFFGCGLHQAHVLCPCAYQGICEPQRDGLSGKIKIRPCNHAICQGLFCCAF